MPAPHHSVFPAFFCRPANSVKALKAVTVLTVLVVSGLLFITSLGAAFITNIISVFAGWRRNTIFTLSLVMQLMFAGHFACSVIYVLGGRVSVQKG